MISRQLIGAAAGAALLMSAGSAFAAVTLSDGEVGGTAVHSDPGQLDDLVTGTIGTDGELVTLQTDGELIGTSGGGASTYTGPFDDFLITFLTGKTIVGFNVEFYNPPGATPTLTTGLSVFVNGNLVGTRANPLGAPQKYFVTADNGDFINTVLLTFSPDVIGSVKQIRVTGTESLAVPEPGAWALMILGFGGVGAMLRQRRPRLASVSA